MEFEFTEDQLELQRAVRDILDAEAPPELARAVADGQKDAADFWQTLVGLEWPAMALPEEADGLGYGWVELAIVLEESGRHAAPGPFMSTVTQFAPLIAEAAGPGQAAELLAPVAAGQTTGTIAVDEGAGTWDPAEVSATGRRSGDDLVLEGTKHYVLDGATADEIAVAVRIEGELRVVLVPGSSVQAVEGIPVDPGVRHATITLDGVRVPAVRLLGDGDASDAIRRALEESVTAVAAVTLGACQRIFDIINAYAKERIQFGVPIGSFQAVKHKLANMYRDIERARVLVYYAALTLAEDHPDRTLAASMAKAAAGEAQRRCVQDGLQLAGGIGYTWEHDLHLFLRRAKVGELHFGSASQHRRKVARLALQSSAA
ncbi:MAG: acyl-CoA dehydrogenase [Acidimicrobiaceae bacterium]|nr:acyl-CoA dehydrogenase [Acidimicrobiaceae bacterium]MYH77825.1 acyl-CoA dehydrogenase [Acidimicrobiaceae bacterium]MYK76170.1 acyl-CoA dehydrogenase [Acidimicrobiaceae bacterium]